MSENQTLTAIDRARGIYHTNPQNDHELIAALALGLREAEQAGDHARARAREIAATLSQEVYVAAILAHRLTADDAPPARILRNNGDVDAYDRDVVLEQLTQEFHDHAKTRAPGGEGLEGADGPERRAVGAVRDAARDWTDALRAQRRRERFSPN